MVLRHLLCSRISQVRSSILRQVQYSTASEMQNAYIHTNEDDKFTFSFHYTNDNLGVDRKFNMSRRSTERISTFLDRIQCNVSKILDAKHAKRLKKAMKKKGDDSSEDTAPLPQVTVELLRSGNPVPTNETCQSILESKDLVMLSLSGKKYHVVVNPPWVDNIQLPKSILSNFPVYPSKFVGSNLDQGESEFVWHKKLPNDLNWQEVGSGFIYTPSTQDINHLLKITCRPKRDMVSGPAVEAISKSTVQAGPGECPFELRHAFTKERASGNGFRVMTYNILAGMYSDTEAAKSELFAHCPAHALDIDYRKQLLMKEILGYNADIICLQEVDEHVFENDLQPILKLKGFTGIFHRKGSVREGLACLVNTKRFRLVDSHLSLLSAEFSKQPYYKNLWLAVEHNEALLKRLQDRGTSSQATVLQSTENPKKWLVIGNTHLYFHPDADHVRLLQSGQTILFIADVVTTLRETHPDAEVSVILCGDFNSTPECGVFQLMTTGNAPENLVDWKSNEAEQITGLSLSQPFKLDSACGTPQYTNFTEGFSGCLDYIFYQTDTLKVKEVLPFYSEEELKLYTALPNIVFPSDHVALVSDIEWST